MDNTQQRAAAIVALSNDELDQMLLLCHPGMERLRVDVLEGLPETVEEWDAERWDGLN